MGSCACPRCLTPKSLFASLGLLNDMRSRITKLRVYAMTNVVKARDFIYKWGNTVDGLKVEHALGEGSWVPTIVSANSFSMFGTSSYRLLLAESICQKTWTTRSGPISHVSRRFHA
jgi:hypothetical protein